MRQGKLNIGLSEYQEQQWIEAIRSCGVEILNKSLLSFEQKQALIKFAAK